MYSSPVVSSSFVRSYENLTGLLDMATRPPFHDVTSTRAPPGEAQERKAVGGTEEMYEMKAHGEQTTVVVKDSNEVYGRTAANHEDMYRMNKKQELQRNFRFLSIFGYSLILGTGWVIALIGAIVPLTNGGIAGGIWFYFIVIAGMTFLTLSMAELASMAPAAGGQYYWVSEFAPREHRQFLLYMTVWLCVLGWQTPLCSTAYSGALTVQGMIALNTPGYTVPSWQGVVLFIGIVLFTIFFNTIFLRKLPMFKGIMRTIHIFGSWPSSSSYG